MKEPNYNDERAIKMIEWLAINPSIEHTLFCEEESVDKYLLEVIEEIERAGYYELIYLLLKKMNFIRQ